MEKIGLRWKTQVRRTWPGCGNTSLRGGKSRFSGRNTCFVVLLVFVFSFFSVFCWGRGVGTLVWD